MSILGICWSSTDNGFRSDLSCLYIYLLFVEAYDLWNTECLKIFISISNFLIYHILNKYQEVKNVDFITCGSLLLMIFLIKFKNKLLSYKLLLVVICIVNYQLVN